MSCLLVMEVCMTPTLTETAAVEALYTDEDAFRIVLGGVSYGYQARIKGRADLTIKAERALLPTLDQLLGQAKPTRQLTGAPAQIA